MNDKEQFAEQNLQSIRLRILRCSLATPRLAIYNLQCRRMQAYACDKRSRNHTYRRPRLKARAVAVE